MIKEIFSFLYRVSYAITAITLPTLLLWVLFGKEMFFYYAEISELSVADFLYLHLKISIATEYIIGAWILLAPAQAYYLIGWTGITIIKIMSFIGRRLQWVS